MNDPNPVRAGPAAPYGVVAIAASAGGITALGRVLGGLPGGFPVPVLIVQHLDPRHKTVIAEVLISKKGCARATRKTPAVNIVAAWISAETGVGPSIASGSHV